MVKRLIVHACEAGFGGLLWIVLDRELSTKAAILGMCSFAGVVLIIHRNDLAKLFRENKNGATRDWVAEWKQVAERFEQIPSKQVRAVWNSESIDAGFGQPVGEQWFISGGDEAKDCESLCILAGVMILQSPAISKLLSEKVRSRSVDSWRWLYFIKERSPDFVMDQHPGKLHCPDRTVMATWAGEVKDLVSTSARVCRECAALELKR